MYSPALSVAQNVLVNVAQVTTSVQLHIKHSKLFSPKTQPDIVKTYSVRPHLSDNRVFLPPSLSKASEVAASPQPKIPLVISAHGSAWIVGNPSNDDTLNRYIADHADVIVVGINYGKAPQHPFPEGLEDIIALVNAVIEDPELPVDPDRVVLLGGSAGANLLLGGAQDERLRGKAKGIIAICPPVDMVTSKADKIASRPHPDTRDVLVPFYDTILTTYLGTEKDSQPLDDTRLSPLYFQNREQYPDHMYLIGFEDDLLCREAETMAEKLVGDRRAVKEQTERGWKCGTVIWEMISEQGHGFAPPRRESSEHKHRREEEHEALRQRISAWIGDLLGTKVLNQQPEDHMAAEEKQRSG